MNYLIFRTDRIGDFLITLPLIKSIKRNDLNAIIDVVTSTKNETQIKANTFVDNTFLLRSNSFIDGLLYLDLEIMSQIHLCHIQINGIAN